ncbi:retinaldehyde-binding protein 1-like [Wyeomyia smithii]|uniref:retinaldehyde-binding protein 1-like n=1 Tax=Wyeomyia smithii TaxID=174621 RepID=UPI002467C9E6|nr:retinaldehyde-binding protein 1-like [Wyeomyia smithii]
MASNAKAYSFTLSNEYRELARKELREDEGTREQALMQMREWIEKNPYIKTCRTDDTFLLKFLRYRKFSVPQATEALERYLVARQKFPEWFRKLDPLEATMNDILKDGPFVVLGRDQDGRTAILIRYSRFNVDKVTPQSICRYVLMMMEVLSEEEEFQIAGTCLWEDHSDMPMKFVGMFSLTELSSILQVLMKTMPVRIRQINWINLPKFAAAIANFARAFVSGKVQERIIVHATVHEAKTQLHESLWPLEYGGKIDVDLLNREMIAKLEEKRDFLLALDDMEIHADHYMNLWKENNPHSAREIDSGIIGSFRKLNVD